MENNYKRLADVDVVESVEDSAHVLVEVDGEIKKTPKSNVGGSGGGTGGVTSWNDLEDKPFYANKEFVEVVPLQSVTGRDLGDVYYFDFDQMPEVGKQYTIRLNGNEYICATQEGQYETSDDGGYAKWIGNASLNGKLVPSDNTGEPFLIDSFWLALSWQKDLGETITIQVSEEKEVVKPLDPKYVDVLGVVFSREYDEAAEAEVVICTKTFKEIKNAWERRIPIVAFENDGFSQTRFTSIDTSTESSQIVSFIFFTEWGHYDVHRDGTVEYVSSE